MSQHTYYYSVMGIQLDGILSDRVMSEMGAIYDYIKLMNPMADGALSFERQAALDELMEADPGVEAEVALVKLFSKELAAEIPGFKKLSKILEVWLIDDIFVIGFPHSYLPLERHYHLKLAKRIPRIPKEFLEMASDFYSHEMG